MKTNSVCMKTPVLMSISTFFQLFFILPISFVHIVLKVMMVCFLFYAPAQAFKTLTEAKKFEKAFDENEAAKSDVGEFKKTLRQVVNQRQNVGYKGRYVVKITPYPGSRFVVWGPVKGAFKSLIRSLTYLQEKAIISDDFKIQAPDTYFVFLGDVLDGTEHALETLMLVLSLMKANPASVIYIRGHREDYLHWQNNGLKKALKDKAHSVSSEKIPLGRSITRFFETLPLALYIAGEHPQDGLVRLSYFGGEVKELEERSCPALTSSRMVNVPELCFLTNRFARAPLLVKAMIKAEDRVMSYKYYSGLTLGEPDRGAIAWIAFSGPTPKYQKDYQFYYDAFSIITTAARVQDFRITLYNRDMRGLDPFAPVGTYALLSGQKMSEKKKERARQSDTSLLAQIEKLQERIKILAREVVQYRQIVHALPIKGEVV